MAIGAGWADGAWQDAGWVTAGDGAWAQDAGSPGSPGTLDASDRNARTSGALAFARRAGFVIAFLLLWSVT